MNSYVAIYTGLHWAAVFFYVLATVANVYGIIFNHRRVEKASYVFVSVGLLLHGAAILYGWITVGHGPYLSAHEGFTSFSWVTLALFVFFMKLYPNVRTASIIVFPLGFLMVALAMFYNPAVLELPPTFRSVWLIFHISFYKIALATIIIALSASIFFIVKKRSDAAWLGRLPDLPILDLFAYRFAGFSFIFWAIGMLAGSIWAYQSWGRFWGWDPVESWSLITWVIFGVYLHLRRFFGWRGERAAWFYIGCFLISLVSMFYSSHISATLHTEYLIGQ